MGLPGLPKIDIDIRGTVDEFLDLLRSIDAKLDTLIEVQRGAATADRLARATDARQRAEATTGSGFALPEPEPELEPAAGQWPGVFGAPCNRPLGVRGNCAKSLGHSGRCKP